MFMDLAEKRGVGIFARKSPHPRPLSTREGRRRGENWGRVSGRRVQGLGREREM
jgi:hypothetical protein